MNAQELRTKVFDKTGIKITDDDPLLASIILHDEVLSSAIKAFEEKAQYIHQSLDEKIGMLIAIQKNINETSLELSEKSKNAQLTAALKAATEARADIMNTAKLAVGHEITKISSQMSVEIVQALEARPPLQESTTAPSWFPILLACIATSILTSTMTFLALKLLS